MRDEDYQLVEHPRLELHIHVATKFVQVIIATRMAMSMLKNVIILAGMLITFLPIMVGAIFLLSFCIAVWFPCRSDSGWTSCWSLEGSQFSCSRCEG